MTEIENKLTRDSSRRLLKLFAGVVVASAILFGVAFFSNDYGHSRQRLPWKCGNYLRGIALGVANYHDVYGAFPPPYTVDASGKKLHSWRTLILPFIDHHILYEQLRLDEPWDSPHNRFVENRYWRVGDEYGELPHNLYHCPSDPEGDKGRPLDASYFVVTGPGTAWQLNRKVGFADLADGAAKTIMVIEVAESGIHWMEPRDFRIDEIPHPTEGSIRQGITRHHVSKEAYDANAGTLDGYREKQPVGGMVVNFEGSVFFMPASMPAAISASFHNIDDRLPGDDWRDAAWWDELE